MYSEDSIQNVKTGLKMHFFQSKKMVYVWN